MNQKSQLDFKANVTVQQTNAHVRTRIRSSCYREDDTFEVLEGVTEILVLCLAGCGGGAGAAGMIVIIH